MKYQFPLITRLDDVLPAIEGCKEIIVADRGDHTIVNYVVVGPDTFPPVRTVNDAIRRECRGLIFSKDGSIIRRPLHKWFNINEREETLAHNIAWDDPFVVMEKLDGSSISSFVLNGELQFGTRMGVTDVALQVVPYVEQRPKLTQFCLEMSVRSYTPIFEWTSPQQRIVLDYHEDKMTLLAIRHIHTGLYASLQSIQDNLSL